MSRKQDKAAKRKAKLKAKRVHEENLRLQFNSRIANAIVDLCAEDLPDYVDDSEGIDLSGRHIIWTMGMIAWNIAVTGRQEIGEDAISKMRLDEESQKIVRDEINKIVRLKYKRYPELRTAVTHVTPIIVDGEAALKVSLGDTFPEMPIPEFDDEPETLTPEQILTKRKELGLSQAKFATALGVSVKKVSAWEHGKAVPDEAEMARIRGMRKLIHAVVPRFLEAIAMWVRNGS